MLKLVGETLRRNFKVISPQIFAHCCGGFSMCSPILWYSVLQEVECNLYPLECGLDSVTFFWLDSGKGKTTDGRCSYWTPPSPSGSELTSPATNRVDAIHLDMREREKHLTSVIFPQAHNPSPTLRWYRTNLNWRALTPDQYSSKVFMKISKEGLKSCHRLEETKGIYWINVMMDPGTENGHQ